MPVLKVKKNGIWEPVSGGGSGGGAIPDWNQNNPAAADYIKNRPFYATQVEKEIYDVNAELTAVSGALTSQQVSATEYLHSTNTENLDNEIPLLDLVEGKRYVVIVDGNRYEYTAKSMVMPEGYNGATALYIGEGEEFISQNIANFTVGIANVVYPNGYTVTTIGCKTTSTTPPRFFKVYLVEEEVKGIDVKYLPEGGFGYSIQKEVKPIFDGNLDGKEYVELNGIALVKVSDYILTEEECIGAELTIVSGEQSGKEPITANGVIDVSDQWGISCYAVMPDNYVQYGTPFVGVLRESGVVDGISVSAGTYYLYDESTPMYVSYFSAFDEATKEIVMQIDPKYYERLAWVDKGSSKDTLEFDGDIEAAVENGQAVQMDEGVYAVTLFDRYIDPYSLVGSTISFVSFDESICPSQDVEITEEMITDMSANMGFEAYGIDAVSFTIENEDGSTSYMSFSIMILSQDFMGMIKKGVIGQYDSTYGYISKVTAPTAVFGDPDIIHTIDPKFFEEGTVGWTEKGSTSNVWEFNGNLNSVEHYQVGEGQYYIRVLDTYQEPEFFIDTTCEVIFSDGNTQTGVFTEDMITDISSNTGFPAYNIQNGMGLCVSQEYNGMPVGFYVIYIPDDAMVSKITFTQDIFGEPDIVHKVHQKYIPNADWSVNDPEAEGYVKNRPFYDGRIIGDISIDWDGSTEDRIVINNKFYKVSDNVITEDQFKEATFTFEGGTYPTSILYSNDAVLVTENYINADFLMIVTTPFDLGDDNGTLAETGIYFSSRNGMSNLTYKDYIGGDFVKIDPIYLPDNFSGGNEIYVQPEAPESPSEGALWVDTDEGSSGGSTGGSTGNCLIELDDTLTQSGKAADAKAVGDALENKQPKGNYVKTVNGIAKVGQVIAVKTIDKNGKPIEWEAISIPVAKEDTTNSGCYYYETTNGVEWINPPMLLDVEYRTTEKWQGKAVYRKMVKYTSSVDIGGTDTYTEIDVPHNITGLTSLVQCHVTANNWGQVPFVAQSGGVTTIVSVDATNVKLRIVNDTWITPTFYIDISYIKE